jgi:hypothetical protein
MTSRTRLINYLHTGWYFEEPSDEYPVGFRNLVSDEHDCVHPNALPILVSTAYIDNLLDECSIHDEL